MDYRRIYRDFIADRRACQPELIMSGAYHEFHHIKPRSLGGSDSPRNLVALTAGDHFFAHLLLAKIHGRTMWAAVFAMCHTIGERRRDKSWVMSRRRWFEKARVANMGENHPRARRVINLDTGVVYKTINSAAAAYGMLPSAVIQSINMGGTAEGCRWAAYDGSKARALESFERQRQARLEQARQGRKRQSSKISGAGNGNARRVINLDTGIIYETSTEAASSVQVGSATIYEALAGKSAVCGGYRWAFYEGDIDAAEAEYARLAVLRKEKARAGHRQAAIKRSGRNHVRAKAVINLDTGEVYETSAAASRAVGRSPAAVSMALNGTRPTAGGYHWAYAQNEGDQ